MDYQLSDIESIGGNRWIGLIMNRRSQWYRRINFEITHRAPILQRMAKYRYDNVPADYGPHSRLSDACVWHFFEWNDIQEMKYSAMSLFSLSGIFALSTLLLCLATILFLSEVCIFRFFRRRNKYV